jgi:MarR family transcriptional regulator, organic hydroperoxide resistance regulator
MAAVSDIYRAANVIRHHMEQKVLADEDLSWAAFTGAVRAVDLGRPADQAPSRGGGRHQGHAHRRAEDAGETGLARRRAHDADRRLVLVSLEPKGVGVIERLFPAFNQGEAFVSASLTEPEKNQLASLLRKIIRSVEES